MVVVTGNEKTTELIKKADGKNKLIVCHKREECHRVFEYAEKIGADINLPITYQEMIEGRYSARNVESLLLDNLEGFLGYVSFGKIEAVSIEDSFKNKITEIQP